MSFSCRRCGQVHPGPPRAYSSTAPGRWYTLSDEQKRTSRLDGELCVVAGGEFFVRANVELPITDGSGALVFSAWVRIEQEVLKTLLDRWEDPERADDPGYPGWLANDLAGYRETIGLPVEIHTDAPGTRARAVPIPSDHRLSVDHWEGIGAERVQALAELLAHPEG